MEQKTIPFNKGIVRNTSLATDGELIECVNLMVRDGQMMNAPKEQKTIEVPEGYTLLYIHPLSPDDRYIYSYNGKITDGTNTIYTLAAGETLYEVKHIGNVLVILTSKRTYYALFTNNSYILYDFDFDLPIDFSLQGDLKFGDPAIVKCKLSEKLSEENLIKKITPLSQKQIDFYPQDFGATGTIPKGTYTLINELHSEESNQWQIYLGTTSVHGKTNIKDSFSFNTAGSETSISVVFEYKPQGRFTTRLYRGKVEYSKQIDTTDEESVNTAFGALNSFINEEAVQKNQFIFPFFVRYAIELKDGSFIKPSAPCLMIPNSGTVPYLTTNNIPADGENITCNPHAMVCKLRCKIGDYAELQKMDGIIQGIAIAVTSPIYKYDQGAKIDKYKNSFIASEFDQTNNNDFSVTAILGYNNDSITKIKRTEIYGLFDTFENNGDSKTYEITPPVHADINKRIEESSVFRVIARIPLTDFSKYQQADTIIAMDEGTIASLDGRPVLSDNTDSLTTISGKHAFIYNNRLNLCNTTHRIFNGYKTTEMYSFYNSVLTEPFIHRIKYTIEITDNHQQYTISPQEENSHISPIWFYYPSTKATKVTFYFKVLNNGNIFKYYKVDKTLKKHPYLNGAYWVDEMTELSYSEGSQISGTEYDKITSIEVLTNSPNKIKTSEVNNPFVMVQTTTLNDRVEALATGTKAVSEGQFGQFPLYAFCDDGIWALEPSSDGTYASKQPVSRDVCSNPRGITQTDNAVIYTTRQGLKMLQGSTVTNISKKMEGKAEDTDAFFKDLAEDYNTLIKADTKDFNEVIQEATMCYDYENNLLHIYTQGFTFQLNLETGDYTRTDTPKPTAIVPGYPHATLQIDRALYQYKKPNPQGERKGILLTRETAFDDPLTMKVITDLRVMRRHGDAKVAVYASNDRENWVRMRSLRMASYKWYRFAVFTNLTNTDVLEGIVTRVETRRTNKMR